jgi:D-alanine-D-alanine ligase
VRIDIKTDAAGALRIMEVNGIPGLKPHKSWAPQIYTLYFGSPEGEMADYRSLIRTVIEAGGSRYGIS